MGRRKLTDEEIISTIFDKMARKRKWNASHIPMDTIVRWISNKIKRNGNRVKKILTNLIKEGFIFSKPAHYGTEISLNSKESEKILELTEEL
ncbi:MAG: hypothetical protein GF368_03630 [Candidatus Aenigmarchaeota archaeon]|nr:hypothetical protein [Candidatus Aenigmarchaeota archaeon]